MIRVKDPPEAESCQNGM